MTATGVGCLTAPDIRFEYSLHAPLRGREAVRAFAQKFRAAFPDLNFWGTAGFARRWQATGGAIVCAVTWPESAASWLRQATRFAAGGPDLWVMAGPATGWAQMTRRLLWSIWPGPARPPLMPLPPS